MTVLLVLLFQLCIGQWQRRFEQSGNCRVGYPAVTLCIAAVFIEGVVLVPDKTAGSKTHGLPIIIGEEAGTPLYKPARFLLLIGRACLQIMLQFFSSFC